MVRRLSGARKLRDHRVPQSRVVNEVAEHALDDGTLAQPMAPRRTRGSKWTVDHAGGGNSSVRHILNLALEFIKLDTSIARNHYSDVKLVGNSALRWKISELYTSVSVSKLPTRRSRQSPR
jgi:EAL domain-containing protein (putative c-di-GMP-specific phosphodiesterase class I)